MKYFLIFFVLVGFAISPYLVFDSFGLCVENQDWQDAPCYGCRGCYPGLEQEKIDWSPYYDFKGSTWMNAKKQQLETAIHNNSLREWFEQSDSGAHKNVHRYYFLQGDVPNTYGMNFDEALGFERAWNAVEDNSPDAPLFLWAYHDVILDGTLIETDLAVTITGDHVPLYHIKANKYFKGDKSSELISAVENPDDVEFELSENGLFYLKKLQNQNLYTVTIASVPTFGNCDARDMIEISPVLPNEKPPRSMPVGGAGIDPCIPDYFETDPDGIAYNTSIPESGQDEPSSESYGEKIIPPPLKQLKSEIPTDKIQCNDDLVLVQKYDGSPACVTEPTKLKLIERGWASSSVTVTIYSNFEQNRDRTYTNPRNVVIDLEKNNSVKWVNNADYSVQVYDYENKLWSTRQIDPSMSDSIQFNNTGYYEFAVESTNDRHFGKIVVISDNTNSLPIETRMRMGMSIVSNDLGKNPALIGVGTGDVNDGVKIDINQKELEKRDDAKSYYYDMYKEMIPFDVPITIEFDLPPKLLE